MGLFVAGEALVEDTVGEGMGGMSPDPETAMNPIKQWIKIIVPNPLHSKPHLTSITPIQWSPMKHLLVTPIPQLKGLCVLLQLKQRILPWNVLLMHFQQCLWRLSFTFGFTKFTHFRDTRALSNYAALSRQEQR